VEARPREIRVYQTEEGREPFWEWLDGIADQEARGIVLNRIDRVERGNLGDCQAVGEGVFELRIDFGPGYRVYFGQDGDLVVLLGGGTKRTQSKDIPRAQAHWRNYHA